MKKLIKSVAPAILSSQDAVNSLNAMQQKVSQSQELKRSDVDSDIYGDPTVKNRLVADQSKLCAYCESFVLHVGPGEIDHYRPIVACSRKKKAHRIKPGYYWLAYDWENLVFACKKCNQKKSCYFPLKNDPTLGVSQQTIGQEQPLLINPYKDDPSLHLEFHEHLVCPKTDEGRASIIYYDLNRNELKDKRRERWSNFKKEQFAREGLKKNPNNAYLKQIVAICDSEPEIEYSGMLDLQKNN